MRTFVNKIQVAASDDLSEICLTLSQSTPSMSDDGLLCEEVSSLIMTNKTAKELIRILTQALNE